MGMLTEVERQANRRNIERAVVEAARGLMNLDSEWWAVREQGSVSWCCLGCGEAAPHGDPHAPDCPAIALEQALAALDKLDQ